jgi:hypothetical protein
VATFDARRAASTALVGAFVCGVCVLFPASGSAQREASVRVSITVVATGPTQALAETERRVAQLESPEPDRGLHHPITNIENGVALVYSEPMPPERPPAAGKAKRDRLTVDGDRVRITVAYTAN